MSDANGADLTQFMRWYRQAGTPVLEASATYVADQQQLRLTLKQTCPATPGQPTKEPFDIPVAVGLIGRGSARPLPLRLEGDAAAGAETKVLRVTEPEQTFVFVEVPEEPVPSLLRNYSAPVKLLCPGRSQVRATCSRSAAPRGASEGLQHHLSTTGGGGGGIFGH